MIFVDQSNDNNVQSFVNHKGNQICSCEICFTSYLIKEKHVKNTEFKVQVDRCCTTVGKRATSVVCRIHLLMPSTVLCVHDNEYLLHHVCTTQIT